MDTRHLLAIEEQLYDDTPVLGAHRRRRAARALAAQSSDDALAILIDAVANGHPRRAGRAALGALIEAQATEEYHAVRIALCGLCLGKGHALWAQALDALCTDRNPGLIATLWEAASAALSARAGKRPLACDALARLAPASAEALSTLHGLCEAHITALWPSALRVLAREGSARSIAILRRAAEQDEVRRLRAAAIRALLGRAGENDGPSPATSRARQALCDLVIRVDIPGLRNAVLAAGYAPHDVVNRALFLFSTAQWQAYDTLDFDRRLLQDAYDAASPALRLRISALARRYGRLEWARVVAADDQADRLSEITPAEWDETVSMLMDAGQWHEIWHLARRAPALHAARMLIHLGEAHWMPPARADRGVFSDLLALARACPTEIPRTGRLGIERVALGGLSSWVSGLIPSPDGRTLLATGLGDRQVWRWRLPDGQPLPPLVGHEGGVRCAALTADGCYLVTGGYDNCARVWRLPEGELVTTCSGPRRWVGAVAISPDGRLFVTAGDDRAVRLWTLPSGEALATLDEHTGWVEALAITPDGRTLVTASRDTTLRLWRLPDGEPLAQLEAHTRPVSTMAVSRDGTLLVTGGQDHVVCLWRLADGELLSTLTSHHAPIDALAISPRGDHLATSSDDEQVCFWGLPDFSQPSRYGYGIQQLRQVRAHLKPLFGAGPGMSDHVITRRAEDGELHIWSLPDARPFMALGAPGTSLSPMNRYALSSDGRVLVSGGEDGSVHLWSSRLARLLHTPIVHTTWDDMSWAERSLKARLAEAERRWLAFALPLMRWRWRADPELAGEAATFGQYDPEI